MVDHMERKNDSKAVNLERSGESTMTVEHDDGSQFEVEGKWPESLSGKMKAPPPPKSKNRFCMGVGFDKAGNIIR